MREIKFRVWDKLLKKMYNIDFIDLRNDGKITVLMQYTELQDKDGKEIYDGDILGYSDESGVKATSKVTWLHAGWYCGGQTMGTLKLEYWKVIGNIHENLDIKITDVKG